MYNKLRELGGHDMIDANLDLLENVLDCMVDLKDSPNRLSSMKDSELEELLSDLESLNNQLDIAIKNQKPLMDIKKLQSFLNKY